MDWNQSKNQNKNQRFTTLKVKAKAYHQKTPIIMSGVKGLALALLFMLISA